MNKDPLIIEAGRGERNYWRDLWDYRELFAILAWRDIAVQYKQTAIGVLWALLKPLLTLVIFTVLFGRLASLPTEGSAPYPLLVMVGMLPWFLVSSIFSQASNSLVANANLISKIYFPRIIVPAASSIVALVDFSISLALLILIMISYHYIPGWQILLTPAFVLLAVFASLGPALLFAALNVRYRDFRFVVPFAVQFGLYISPVGFSSSIIPEQWQGVYALNPVVGVIDGFRWCVLSQNEFNWQSFTLSVLVTALMLIFGLRIFRATEKGFVDVV